MRGIVPDKEPQGGQEALFGCGDGEDAQGLRERPEPGPSGFSLCHGMPCVRSGGAGHIGRGLRAHGVRSTGKREQGAESVPDGGGCDAPAGIPQYPDRCL